MPIHHPPKATPPHVVAREAESDEHAHCWLAVVVGGSNIAQGRTRNKEARRG